MDFDLTRPPLSNEQLNGKRRRLAQQIQRIEARRFRVELVFLGAFVLMVAAGAVLAGEAVPPVAVTRDLWHAVFVLGLTGVLALGFVERQLSARIQHARQALDALVWITAPHARGHGLDILIWCACDDALARYRRAVAAQGRALVCGEHAAMQRWVETGSARATKKVKARVAP